MLFAPTYRVVWAATKINDANCCSNNSAPCFLPATHTHTHTHRILCHFFRSNPLNFKHTHSHMQSCRENATLAVHCTLRAFLAALSSRLPRCFAAILLGFCQPAVLVYVCVYVCVSFFCSAVFLFHVHRTIV